VFSWDGLQLGSGSADTTVRLWAAPDWKPVAELVTILGQLDGIMTGIRQLRRTEPLETEIAEGLRVPTLPEMARIKGWLLATRYTVRDLLDTVVLFERLGEAGTEAALSSLDRIYAQPTGASFLTEVAERLGAASPADRADRANVDLGTHRGLVAPWNQWAHLESRARFWAPIVARIAMQGEAP
jgi:hypothetical protein